MLLARLLIICLYLIKISDETPKINALFISPVKIPLALSANFGELRSDHFHSGIDLKTQGVIGKEIVAAASGYVYRISVAPGGFGKALYIRHPSTGYSTVYAHLDRFAPGLEEYVKTRQYEEKSFQVNLFPPRVKFHFRQGEVIAFSGNTGSSTGPHLHYEIRKSENEIPVNPLLFEFGIEDNIAPVIEMLAIYPLNSNTLINNQNRSRKIKVAGGHGNYYIPAENVIRINGPAGFGIKSYDLLNNSYNKCVPYTIELIIDSIPVYRFRMDAFAFGETRYINSHIDYETYIRERTHYQRTYILPNDKLSVYQHSVNRGIFNFKDGNTHHIEIIVTDLHNNRSVLSFNVRSGDGNPPGPARRIDNESRVMPYGLGNKFATKDVSINIPQGALYDTLYFIYRKSAGTDGMFSGIHQIHNRFTPLHRSYALSIKPDRVPAGKESKLLIIQTGDGNKRTPLNSTWENGYLHAQASTFGNFFVGIDTIPPVITASGLSQGINLSGRKEMRIRISDNLSGIKSYEPVIDGLWALFEYDQKNNVLIYKFDEERISKGTDHNLTLKVTDNRDNFSIYTCDFFW